MALTAKSALVLGDYGLPHAVVTGTGALFAMQLNGWDRALKVTADGTGLVGHAGAVLLRKTADQAGLTAQLCTAMRKKGTSPVFDRGAVLVSLAAAIALGATSMSDIALLAHLAPVLGDAPSGPTVRRALDLAGTAAVLDKIARARAKARAHAWMLVEDTPAGFPWLKIAGKTLTGWLVINMDATLVTASSEKEGAAPTWKKGYGFHPLGARAANTREPLAMLLRPGNAGSDTFTDHKEVLAAALRQVPARFRRKIVVRVDGAGASHDLINHLLSLSSPRRMPRTSPPTWPPGPASSILRRGGAAGRRPRHAPLPRLAHSRPPGPSRPRTRPEDQPQLAVEGRVPRLLAAALRPASTHMTSASGSHDRKEDHPGAVGAGAHPGTPAVPRTTRPQDKQT